MTYFEIEKTWKWRDIYEIGFVEGNNGVDYPFLNAWPLPRKDINFFTSRTVRKYRDTVVLTLYRLVV